MDPPPILGRGPPTIKIKKEVKEEPEYIYVDETVGVALSCLALPYFASVCHYYYTVMIHHTLLHSCNH